jgi:hypothetical protein
MSVDKLVQDDPEAQPEHVADDPAFGGRATIAFGSGQSLATPRRTAAEVIADAWQRFVEGARLAETVPPDGQTAVRQAFYLGALAGVRGAVNAFSEDVDPREVLAEVETAIASIHRAAGPDASKDSLS